MAIETIGAALRQINRLFSDGVVTGLSDGQLLDRFLAERDGAAFEMLMARHGPMVLSVCRGVLRNPADAEDAFQATFLVLVNKARTLRGRAVLGGWLHLVAYRVAIQANAATARRRMLEKKAGEMAVTALMCDPAMGEEVQRALHEEIARLPDRYRLPIVLCDLEGIAQAQAAGQLRWSERSLRRRLAEGRERLKARLGGCGLTPEGTVMGMLALRQAPAAVPAAWGQATLRAALATMDHAVAVGVASAAAEELTQKVLKTMLLQKLTLASTALLGVGLMAWATTTALSARSDEPAKGATPSALVQRTTPAPERQPGPDPFDSVGTFPVHGRVLDPDGQPVANAEIYIRHHTEQGSDPADPAPTGQKGRVAVSDADGRFGFELDKASSDWPYGDEPAWHNAQIAAVAPGWAMAWVEAGSLLRGGEATLRLVGDDVPIHGRVLDSQGRPVAGATVRLRRIGTVKDGVDLDAMLASGELNSEPTSEWYGYNDAIWPGGQNTWTTDADGRFEARGIGRDRIGWLEFHGPMLANGSLYVMARPARTPPKPRPRPTRRDKDWMFVGSPPRPLLVGSTFEQIAAPTKPITGVVRSKATGQPLERIKVSGMEGATWTSVAARTDAQGRFLLVGLPKSEFYQVSANDRSGAVAPFLRAQITVTDTEGLKPIETTLELPKGVIVTGRLIDTATGRPVQAQQASYCKLPTNPNEGYGTEFPTGRIDPSFRMTVPPGQGMIFVRAWGKDLPYTRARLKQADKGKGVGGIGDGETYTVVLGGSHAYKIVDVPAGANSFAVDLELTRGLARTGRVVDPEGKPVSGAQCYGSAATWGEMKVLTDATFEVLGLEPDHPRLVVFAHKGRRLVGSVIIKGEESKCEEPLVVRLEPPASLKGRLVDDDGLPVAGATLRTLSIDLDGSNLPPNPGPDALWPDNETVTTDANGRFQIDGLKPGVKTNSSAELKGQPNVRLDTGKVLRDIVIQKAGEVRDLGDVKVKVVRQ